ncbi:MAG: SH3 domain-containing protein [Eubacteriales bacterium]|nr:SH3 domain-containing protein [Eubacteriales bacterium]
MKKRTLSVLVLVLLLVSMLPVVSASALIGPQYVSTGNGKGLYLRSGPSKDYDILTSIPYGAQVDSCEYYDSVWCEVTYKGYDGYCMRRYLSSTKPGVTPTPTPSGDTTISYKNFSKTNYYVTVRPSTPSGFVNLRWAPSKKTDVQSTYYAGYTLRVLAQDSTWAQVLDEGDGTCGFMMRSFLTDAGDGGSFGSTNGN